MARKLALQGGPADTAQVPPQHHVQRQWQQQQPAATEYVEVHVAVAPAVQLIRLQLCPGAESPCFRAVHQLTCRLLSVPATHCVTGAMQGVGGMKGNMNSDANAAREDTVFVQPPTLKYIRRLAVAGTTCKNALLHTVLPDHLACTVWASEPPVFAPCSC